MKVEDMDRQSVLVESIEETESISHLRFRKAGTMRVRFKMAGAMTPRVIDVHAVVEERVVLPRRAVQLK